MVDSQVRRRVQISCRYLASMGALATVIAFVLLAPVGVAGQAPPGIEKMASSDVPRTPWGDPALQGIWTNATITPLERPSSLAGTEFLTKEEATEFEQQTLQLRNADRRDLAPENDVRVAYNQFWYDRGTKVTGEKRTSLIVDPPDGRIPWTQEARKQNSRSAARYGVGPFDSWLDMDTGERCLTDGLPMVPLQGYNMNYHILQTPGYVVILHEMFHELRIIPLDGRPHLGQNIHQWLGDPRARWVENTLVVETTNFANKTHYRWAATWRASRPTLHLVERFTRVDAETINYQFTINDPTMFTRPWTAAVPMTTNQAARGVTSGQIFEYACHEGNYSMVNVLKGARATEEGLSLP